MAINRNFDLHNGAVGAAIVVKITPRMSHNEIQEIMEDGTIKIRLTAPPVDGKANKNLIEYLAEVLNISESQIEIVAGQTNKKKLLSIIGMNVVDVNQKILQVIKKT